MGIGGGGVKKKKVVRERDLLWISLSKRETLPVWTRMVAVNMHLKTFRRSIFILKWI